MIPPRAHSIPALPRPFAPAFSRADRRRRVVLVPNLSRSFSTMSAAVLRSLGYDSRPLPLADAAAQQLGKHYVHNDMCFPAQISVGEFLRFLGSEGVRPRRAALILAKNCEDCRAGQYAAIARKALDDAGYADAALLTTGPDSKGVHPGFTPGLRFQLRMLRGMALMDALDSMVRATRPYECEQGSTDRLYEKHLALITRELERGFRPGLRALAAAVSEFNALAVDRKTPRPTVFVIGEILMNYHETANRRLVQYLEKNGMEVILPEMVTFFWRRTVIERDAARRRLVSRPLVHRIYAAVLDAVIRRTLDAVDWIHSTFRFYARRPDVEALARNADDMVDIAIQAGEGWLIPAEIIHHARRGVSSFIIIQPFGCLPNQITGKGVIKPLKERFPYINILSLDYDDDISMANLENRLQMLVMAAKGYAL